MSVRELDVRTIPPPQRHGEVFAHFDSLAAGEAFVLVNDDDPRPLLGQLQATRAGRFEWNVLEEGPALFRVEIHRRAVEGARGVTEYLEADHSRLDAIVADALTLAQGGSFERASARFAELVCGLARHIDVEEKLLFPAFEQRTGMTNSGPTFVMRREHVEIRRLMDEVASALERADGARAAREIASLTEALAGHNVKEERMLYPLADRAMGDEGGRDELVRRMQLF